MSFQVEPEPEGEIETSLQPEVPSAQVGRIITLHFLLAALRRRRRLWMGLACVGALLGASYQVVKGPSFSATTTVYLAQMPGGNAATGMANDVALLQTRSVAVQSIARLRERLDSKTFLGKTPGKALADNVMAITVSGPSVREAVRRADAVAATFLAFRGEQYGAQTRAIVSALKAQSSALQSQINSLNATIHQSARPGAPAGARPPISQFVTERSQDTTNLNSLQQAIQQDNVDLMSMLEGSQVITGAIPAHTSAIKSLLIDVLSGLVGGLALGAGLVALAAVLADRLRQREEIARVIGAPVELCIASLGRGRRTPRRLRGLAARPTPALQRVVRYLFGRVAGTGSTTLTLALVAADDPPMAATVLTALAREIVNEGWAVLMVDLTASRALARLFKSRAEGVSTISLGSSSMTLVVPPEPGCLHDLPPRNDPELAEPWAAADAVLVLASVELDSGAWHLKGWADEAVMFITAGVSGAMRLQSTAELVRAAGVHIASAVLVGTDDSDDSCGLVPDAGNSPLCGVHEVTSVRSGPWS